MIRCIHRQDRTACEACATSNVTGLLEDARDQIAAEAQLIQLRACRAALEQIATLCEQGKPSSEIHRVARLTLRGTA